LNANIASIRLRDVNAWAAIPLALTATSSPSRRGEGGLGLVALRHINRSSTDVLNNARTSRGLLASMTVPMLMSH